MTLRRRGELLPLERRTADVDTDDENIFDHYVSPCEFRVSNDPLYLSEEDACDTKLVGCVHDHEFLPDTRKQTKELRLQYEYDLYYKFDSKNYNFWETLNFLEGAMLEHLSSSSVLDKEQCGKTDEEELRRDTRRYLQEVFSEDVKKAIVAISSDPEDEQNREYGT
jgi:hypothetical protein